MDKIETENNTIKDFSNLIKAIKESLLSFEAQKNLIKFKKNSYQKYPIENEFAVSFDPLTQSKELLEHWYRYGFVVSKDVVTSEVSNNEKSILKDSEGTAILSRGFFEIYHDDCLAQIRQSICLYLHYCLIWNTPYLWTTFDRIGIKASSGESSVGLNLHVDQNPMVHSNFTTVQGVLALEDCPLERGTFVAVPNSIKDFHEYKKFIKEHYKGKFIELPYGKLKDKFMILKQEIALCKNSIVSWDSRTTHANSSNISSINRYVSMGLAKKDRPDLVKKF